MKRRYSSSPNQFPSSVPSGQFAQLGSGPFHVHAFGRGERTACVERDAVPVERDLNAVAADFVRRPVDRELWGGGHQMQPAKRTRASSTVRTAWSRPIDSAQSDPTRLYR